MLCSLFITGCFGQKSIEEKIFDVLEKVVAVEKDFEGQQDPLIKLAREEKKLYENILSIATKDQDQVAKLADEAIVIVKKREVHLNEEIKSIEASEREFEKLNPLIGKLNDKELEEQAEELAEVMNKRYEIHRKLANFYLEGLALDTELYNMLKDKNRPDENLQGKVILINETYDEVLQANEKFTELTDTYNETKMSFYKVLGLKVSKKQTNNS